MLLPQRRVQDADERLWTHAHAHAVSRESARDSFHPQQRDPQLRSYHKPSRSGSCFDLFSFSARSPAR